MSRQGMRCCDIKICWLGDSMLRKSMEAVEGFVSRQKFPCYDRGCLNEGIFRSRHRLLSSDRDRA